MSIKDKLTGKIKQAASDLTNDPSLRREGRDEERKGKKKEEFKHADEMADLERRT